MTTSVQPRPAPDWTDWRQWVEGTDWSDWRSWLQRISSADWAAAPWTGAPWEQPPDAGTIPLTLRAFAEDEPGDQIAGHLHATWPVFRRWWHGGAQRPAVRGRGQGPARGAHARARAHLAAAERHARGRSRRRGGAGAVEPAAVPDRLLPGGGPARRPRPGQELRLGLPAVRRGGGPDVLRRAPGARHARLPVGPAGRGQRRRAGRLADLRRPAAGRRRASGSRW